MAHVVLLDLPPATRTSASTLDVAAGCRFELVAGFCEQYYYYYYYYYYTRLTASFPGQPGYAGTRKVKSVWF